MIESLQKLLKLIISLFGANVAQDRDWDSIAPELMTPREKLLRRVSLTLLAGALVNCAAGLLLIALAVGAARGNQPTFAELQSALLGALVISADNAALLIIAGVFGNMALLLALAVTIRAGELWTVAFRLAAAGAQPAGAARLRFHAGPAGHGAALAVEPANAD